jgi:hypothetical protein
MFKNKPKIKKDVGFAHVLFDTKGLSSDSNKKAAGTGVRCGFDFIVGNFSKQAHSEKGRNHHRKW